MKKQTIRCPYCGSPAILKDTSYVYGHHSSGGMVYVCSHYPACDSYVGVHQGTSLPKGSLANPTLRKKRIQAHQIFDQLWRKGIFSREEAYQWIGDKFCLQSPGMAEQSKETVEARSGVICAFGIIPTENTEKEEVFLC